MALVKKSSNSNRFIIIGMAIVVVAGVGYFLFKQLSAETGNINGSAASRFGPAITKNFGDDLLNDPRFTQLRSFSSNINFNINAVTAGNPDPFH